MNTTPNPEKEHPMFKITSYSAFRSTTRATFAGAVEVAETFACEGGVPSTIEGFGSRWVKWPHNGPELREGPGYHSQAEVDADIAEVDATRRALNPTGYAIEDLRVGAAALCDQLRADAEVPVSLIAAVRRIQYAAEEAAALLVTIRTAR